MTMRRITVVVPQELHERARNLFRELSTTLEREGKTVTPERFLTRVFELGVAEAERLGE